MRTRLYARTRNSEQNEWEMKVDAHRDPHFGASNDFETALLQRSAGSAGNGLPFAAEPTLLNRGGAGRGGDPHRPPARLQFRAGM